MRNRKILFIIFSVIFIVSITMMGIYYVSQKKNNEIYEELRETVVEEGKEDEIISPTPAVKEITVTPTIVPVNIPIDFNSLKKTNEEIYAWIHIPDTNVDYPILQCIDDDSYYLNHTIEKKEGLPGAIYTESYNKTDFSDYNTVIYGHNMKDGSMFGELKKYMDASYMKDHREIIIYTENHIFTYKVFGAITYDNRHILQSFDFSKKEARKKYLDSLYSVRNMSTYIDSEISVTQDDKIITLSTCNSNNEQRFLIEAVLVDEK